MRFDKIPEGGNPCKRYPLISEGEHPLPMGLISLHGRKVSMVHAPLPNGAMDTDVVDNPPPWGESGEVPADALII